MKGIRGDGGLLAIYLEAEINSETYSVSNPMNLLDLKALFAMCRPQIVVYKCFNCKSVFKKLVHLRIILPTN